MRRCIGCMQLKLQSELIRFTLKDGKVTADTDGRADGRGFYLCRSEECTGKSFKRKAWNRICKSNVDTEEIRRVIGQASGNN